MMTPKDALTAELIVLRGQLQTLSIERETIKKRIKEVEEEL